MHFLYLISPSFIGIFYFFINNLFWIIVSRLLVSFIKTFKFVSRLSFMMSPYKGLKYLVPSAWKYLKKTIVKIRASTQRYTDPWSQIIIWNLFPPKAQADRQFFFLLYAYAFSELFFHILPPSPFKTCIAFYRVLSSNLLPF